MKGLILSMGRAKFWSRLQVVRMWWRRFRSGATGVLTLWQRIFSECSATYSWTPTVPVMHLKVNGSAGFVLDW